MIIILETIDSSDETVVRANGFIESRINNIIERTIFRIHKTIDRIHETIVNYRYTRYLLEKRSKLSIVTILYFVYLTETNVLSFSLTPKMFVPLYIISTGLDQMRFAIGVLDGGQQLVLLPHIEATLLPGTL